MQKHTVAAQAENQASAQAAQLNKESWLAIVNAKRRLAQLESAAVQVPGADVERASLRRFVEAQVAAHSNELLGAWWAVETEYEPLIQGFAGLINRAANILGGLPCRQPQQPACCAEPCPTKQGEASNVVPLTK